MFETPAKIAALMRGFQPPWFVAGGWAIDLFLGKQTRPHADIEIAVFRKDQLELQNYFKNQNLKKVVNGGLQAWKSEEILELPVHEIHCFDGKSDSPFLEVLLNETSGDDWIFRRDERITKSVSEIFSVANSEIKFLRPEIVLLYKSKNPRAKDERDFQAVVSHLEIESKKWLADALKICFKEHRWLESL